MLTRVLVVDDDALDAVAARDVLAGPGVDVVVVHDPRDALGEAARGVALVVTDVSMPAVDGPALVAALRAAGCPAPVVAMTSAPTDESRRRCLAAGAVACLGKPVHEGSLGVLAAALLAGRDAPPLDLDLDDELRGRLCARFVAELPHRRGALARAVAPRDVASAAHALAGPSAQFGFTGLAAICRAVEVRARAGRPTAELVRAALEGAQAVRR